MEESKKRKSGVEAEDGGGKKSKVNYPSRVPLALHSADAVVEQRPKQWRVPKKIDRPWIPPTASSVDAGDSGIWATCSMHKEAKCIAELQDIFDEVNTPPAVLSSTTSR